MMEKTSDRIIRSTPTQDGRKSSGENPCPKRDSSMAITLRSEVDGLMPTIVSAVRVDATVFRARSPSRVASGDPRLDGGAGDEPSRYTDSSLPLPSRKRAG
jgi:hypothetical protein